MDVDVGDVLVAGGEEVLGAGFIVAERGAAVLRGAGHHEKGKTERAGAAQQSVKLDDRCSTLTDQPEQLVQPVQPLALPAKATINEVVTNAQSRSEDRSGGKKGGRK